VTLTLVPLQDAQDGARFGGKAAGLARLLGLSLPVPPGFALDAEAVDTLIASTGGQGGEGGQHESYASTVIEATRDLRLVAVRSSALDEDGAAASFAGQHLTKVGVAPGDVLAAIGEVHASARAPSALAYRAKMGITTPPRVAVVVQELVEPVAAGVLFTRDPLDGSDVLVVEGALGFGEAVVAGLVTPDSWRLAKDGAVLSERLGIKDLRLALSDAPGGGTREVPVDDETANAPCLDDRARRELARLAGACMQRIGAALDIEWAVDGAGRVWLLQCRPITRARS
jgi:pyruvate, water dikinase